jgi:serine/threonine protein kinase
MVVWQMSMDPVVSIVLVVFVVLVGLILLAGLILMVALARRKPVKPPPAPSIPAAPKVSPIPGAPGPSRPSPPPLISHTPYLLAESGTLHGQPLHIQPAPGGLTLGRGPDNDVVLDSMMASRRHAQVMPEGAQYVLYDRDSTNGTYVNDQRVYRHTLAPGDRVQIGDWVFTFVAPGQPAPKPSAPPVSKDLAQQYPLHTVFEGFMLLELLGYGGMSVVYKAQDAAGQIMAIKILDVTDEWVRTKFIQEGKIGEVLRGHPRICSVHELRRSSDGRLYLVEEFIEGASLRKHVGAPMPPDQVISVAGQVCEALHFAHQHNIVHRDIKPENIMLGSDGMVKVTDFGIAKLTSSVTITKDRIVGTPEYISPEQARGDEQIKPASDIYSLGVVLYEMLTGRLPFDRPRSGEEREAWYTLIRQHIKEAPTPPSRLTPSVAPHLERVVLRALEKEPSKRFATASEMALALGYDSSTARRAAPEPALQAMQLVIVEGSAPSKTILLAEADVEIGRTQLDPTNLMISRRHAILSRRGQAWWLKDISRNGTWVNGQRVYDQVPLDSGALIEIGGAKLRLVSQPGEA